MTDNRTTELQSLSKLKLAGRLRYWRRTIEMPEAELHAICDEIQAEHDQAIAATLGNRVTEDSIDAWLRDFQLCHGDFAEVDGSIIHDLWAALHNDIPLGYEASNRLADWLRVATLGCGTLTAEQVMAIAGRHQPDYCSDTHVCFDWQAIADELNATLGSGECEYIVKDNMNETEGMGDVWFECSECGKQFDYHADEWLIDMPFSPCCGRRVRR